MPTYHIHYSTETKDESEATFVSEEPASNLQIVEAAVRHAHPDEAQEIGDVFDIVIDDPGMTDALSLMAEWGVLTLWYTVDDSVDPVHL